MVSFEESLVRHASPTLAGIKVANLYNHKFSSHDECITSLAFFNALMNDRGIYVELLQNKGDFYLIYVYRKSHLQKLLEGDAIKDFLTAYGYPVNDGINACLDFLKEKINYNKNFPHEIGVFLGYPLIDVIGFIENNGHNCSVCGEWKAYHDKDSATCAFCRYNHCKDVYLRVYSGGREFSRMLVSA